MLFQCKSQTFSQNAGAISHAVNGSETVWICPHLHGYVPMGPGAMTPVLFPQFGSRWIMALAR